jgi:protein-S-isoprenylcysteine O-methyltransferase Ste14
MLTRYFIAFVFWLAWLLPFIRKAARPREQAVVKDPSARWGMILEGVASGIVWSIPSDTVPAWRILVAVFMAAVGILTITLALRHLDKHWRFDAALNANHALIRTGPYAVVRHPIYAAMFAMILATGLLLAPWPVLLAGTVIFIVGTEIRVHAEDRLLRSRFGEEFDSYSTRVPAYVPFIR